MIRLILSIFNAPALILLVAIGVALQTSLFNSYPLLYLQPDVVLLAVVWCALRRGFVEGGVLTLILAYVAELHSSAPRGLFLLSYMIVYLLTRQMNRFFLLSGMTSFVFVVMAGSVIVKLCGLSTLFALGKGYNQWRHTLSLLLPGSVITGATAIWVFRWLEKFDRVTYKDRRARQCLMDELAIDEEGL